MLRQNMHKSRLYAVFMRFWAANIHSLTVKFYHMKKLLIKMSNMLSLQDKRVLMRGIIRLTYMSLIAVMSSFVSSCDSEPMDGAPFVSPFMPTDQQIEIPSDGGSVALYTCPGWREKMGTMSHPIPWVVGGFPLYEWNIPIDRAEFDFDTTPLYLRRGIVPPTGGMDGVYFLDGVHMIFLEEHPDGSLTAKVRWLDVRIMEDTLEVKADVNGSGVPRLISFEYGGPYIDGHIDFYQLANE